MSDKNFRSCEISQEIAYLPGFPDNWKSELLRNLATHEQMITWWAFILHDKDVKDDGITPKSYHAHLVLQLNGSYKASTIGAIAGVPAQYVESIKQKKPNSKHSDPGGALTYLTHRNAPEKHQYDDSEVVAKDGFDWKAVRAKSEKAQAENKSLTKTLAGIESGEIRRFNLYNHISQQAYIKNKQEFERAFEYREMKIAADHNRRREVIFITGDSATGKTTYAKMICENKNFSYFVSGSSRDPLQGYGGQDVIVMDDIRPSIYTLSDLLKLLDNDTSTAAGARYRDKTLEVSLIIITTVLSVKAFFNGVKENLDEPIIQFKRRCKTMICMTETDMRIYIYSADKQDYIFVSTVPNPVAEMFKKESDPAEETRRIYDFLGIAYTPGETPKTEMR